MKKTTSKPDPHPFKAFVTGSRVYGQPRVDSDIDLVVFLSPADLERLTVFGQQMTSPEDPDYVMAGGIPFRFGDLNLLCVTDEKKYEVWKKGTRHLKRQKPVTRGFAVRYFRDLRKKAGFHIYEGDDEPEEPKAPKKRLPRDEIPF